MNRFVLAAALVLSVTSAHAELVTIRYDFTGGTANHELMWGWFGADRGPTTGHILSTTIAFEDYTTTGAQNAADFYFTFDVPTFDGTETHIGLTGADLGWTGQGSFDYSLTTDVYNGEIRPGRFASELDGGGEFVGASYVEFLVDADPIDPIFADEFEAL
jgi:hypothetical protein